MLPYLVMRSHGSQRTRDQVEEEEGVCTMPGSYSKGQSSLQETEKDGASG